MLFRVGQPLQIISGVYPWNDAYVLHLIFYCNGPMPFNICQVLEVTKCQSTQRKITDPCTIESLPFHYCSHMGFKLQQWKTRGKTSHTFTTWPTQPLNGFYWIATPVYLICIGCNIISWDQCLQADSCTFRHINMHTKMCICKDLYI